MSAYDPIATAYDSWRARLEDDLAFWVREARTSGGPVLELGAGTGRVTIPIAAAGIPVTGIDTSEAMLGVGRARAEALGVGDRIAWITAPMQEHVATPPVPLVICPFGSFMHLTTTAEQLATLQAVRASLLPGGLFIASLSLPDPARMAAGEGRRALQVEFDDEVGRRCSFWSTPVYDRSTQMVWMHKEVERDGVVITEATVTARLVYRYEMEHLLERAGFVIEALHGDYDEGPLKEDGSEMIWVARR